MQPMRMTTHWGGHMNRYESSGPVDFDKAIDVLCSDGNRKFMQEVAEKMKKEPGYLTLHEFSISMSVSTRLSKAGIRWPAEVVSKYQREALLSALKRLELL